MDGLGDLGFWLAVGMVVAANSVSGALKEREKERERQATLRALLERGDEGATEVIAYLRERDAAEAARYVAAAARAHAMNVRFGNVVRTIGALLLGAFSIYIGVFAFEFLPRPESGSRFLSTVAMVGIWAVGMLVAALIFGRGRFGKRKNDAQPDA